MLAQGFLALFFGAAPHLDFFYFQSFELSTKSELILGEGMRRSTLQ